VFLAFLVFFFTNFLFSYIMVTPTPSTTFRTSPSTALRINGSFTLTINSSSILSTSTVHICSPINMRGIRITIKVVAFLVFGEESGEGSQWVRRICGAEILTLQLKKGV
jgi:hypothetical protein